MAGSTCQFLLWSLHNTEPEGLNPDHHTDLLTQLCIITSIIMWFALTVGALFCSRVISDGYNRLMLCSMGVMLFPIAHRFFLLTLFTPAAMMLRCLLGLLWYTLLPWRVQWGTSDAPWAVAIPTVANSTQVDALPYVLSYEGFGEAEHAMFGLSAWFALCFMILFFLRQITVHEHDIKHVKMANVARTAAGRIKFVREFAKPMWAQFRSHADTAFKPLMFGSALFALCVLTLTPWCRVLYMVARIVAFFSFTYAASMVAVGSVVLIAPLYAAFQTVEAGHFLLSFVVGGGTFIVATLFFLGASAICAGCVNVVYSIVLGLILHCFTCGLILDFNPFDVKHRMSSSTPQSGQKGEQQFQRIYLSEPI